MQHRMANLTTAERLVAVETRLESLEKTAQETKSGVERMNEKLSEAIPSFVTQQQLHDAIQSVRDSRAKDTLINVLITTPIAGMLGFFLAQFIH